MLFCHFVFSLSSVTGSGSTAADVCCGWIVQVCRRACGGGIILATLIAAIITVACWHSRVNPALKFAPLPALRPPAIHATLFVSFFKTSRPASQEICNAVCPPALTVEGGGDPVLRYWSAVYGTAAGAPVGHCARYCWDNSFWSNILDRAVLSPLKRYTRPAVLRRQWRQNAYALSATPSSPPESTPCITTHHFCSVPDQKPCPFEDIRNQ